MINFSDWVDVHLLKQIIVSRSLMFSEPNWIFTMAVCLLFWAKTHWIGFSKPSVQHVLAYGVAAGLPLNLIVPYCPRLCMGSHPWDGSVILRRLLI